MRLAVVNDWYNKKSAVFFNKDGFLTALGIMNQDWDVVFFKKHERTFTFDHESGIPLHFSPDPKTAVMDWAPDAILFFCDFSRPILEEFRGVDIPKAQAYTGGAFRQHEDVADIIFVESADYFDDFQARGLNVRRAFGVNTGLFRPMPQPKVFDAVFPATFAAWKRHNLFADAMGERGLACGYWQPHEPQVTDYLQEKGVPLLHHQNAESTALVYNMGKTCVITSADNGGSQRTVLEAMACNIPLIVMNDSRKTSEYVRACGTGEIVEPNPAHIRAAVEKWKDRIVDTRQWVVDNYSEHVYAEQMKKGILSIC